MDYSIHDHKHRFSAWAASRAASVKNCRFDVANGKKIIETVGLDVIASSPDNLPAPAQIDAAHREWRESAISAALGLGMRPFSHGIAAKLINVYLKGMITCGGHESHPNASSLHPPIDRLLLDELYSQNIGGLRAAWSTARKQSWSNFNSEQYEAVILAIRQTIGEMPLWRIENHWRGYQ